MSWWPFCDELARSRCRELLEHIEKLKSAQRALELEYEALYDKVRSALQRISKRAEVVERAQQEGNATAESSATGDSAGNGAPLTPRQKAVQQQILKRRAGLMQ